jgi:nucleotide-binding universal stress UspA family protein
MHFGQEGFMPATVASLRLSFKNVLFPTDFSNASAGALPYALAIAKTYGSKLYLTHAVTPEPPLTIPLEPIPLEMDPLWQQARGRLSDFLNSSPVRYVLREGVLEQGDLWGVLDDVIHRHGIDLIVLGCSGRHGLKKLVLGSSAEQVFRHASCPVMTIGPDAAGNVGSIAAFRNIVYATDFSKGSLSALPYALSLAEENQAHLTLAHFIPIVPMQHQEEVRAATMRRLRELVPHDAEDWCRINFVVSFEFAAEGILQLAEAEQANLIVMGVHGTAPRGASHLPWAIAYEVVCHASCPVLTVRG